MIAARRTNFRVALVVSLAMLGLAYLLFQAGGGFPLLLAAALALLHFPVWVYALTQYARAKGYPWYAGLLGLFHWVGFIVLRLLPDKEEGQEGDDADERDLEQREPLSPSALPQAAVAEPAFAEPVAVPVATPVLSAPPSPASASELHLCRECANEVDAAEAERTRECPACGCAWTQTI